MFNFDEILKQELPSKRKAMMESLEQENSLGSECGPVATEDPFDDIDIEKDLEDIDISELDDVTEDDLVAVDNDDEAELSSDEEIEADKITALVATPMLLDKELNESAALESFLDEFQTVVAEGFLMESDLDDYLQVDMDDLMTEARVFANKTRVQLDEKDRRKQLFEVGVQASARAANDPLYWKLQKCYKLERELKAKLRQKYRGEALKRVKAYIKRLKSSSSKILSGLGKKITGDN